MPTLIRFFLFIAFLGALVFGGMIALVTLVEPADKEVSVRIQTKDLLGS